MSVTGAKCALTFDTFWYIVLIIPLYFYLYKLLKAGLLLILEYIYIVVLVSEGCEYFFHYCLTDTHHNTILDSYMSHLVRKISYGTCL